MAIADASYRFLYIHVGSLRRQSDGGVWETDLKKDLENGDAELPDSQPYLIMCECSM